MKIKEIAEALNWKLLAGSEGIENEVAGFYAGDLLSWVMGRAGNGSLWFTVMGNVNAVAVALLTDVAGIVLTEGAPLDEDGKIRADVQGIPIYSAEENTAAALLGAYELEKKHRAPL